MIVFDIQVEPVNCCFIFVVVQAEKEAKRKARAKELKKLRKAREKKAQVHKIFVKMFSLA